jgi:hypothetical protein
MYQGAFKIDRRVLDWKRWKILMLELEAVPHNWMLCIEGVCFLLIYYYLVCEAIGSAATPGLLCQPRVIVKMIVEKQMEYRLCRGNRSSRRNPAPAPLLSITKSNMTRPGFEPGPPRWEAGDYPSEKCYNKLYKDPKNSVIKSETRFIIHAIWPWRAWDVITGKCPFEYSTS